MEKRFHKIRQSSNLMDLLDNQITEFNDLSIEVFAGSVIVNGRPFTPGQIIQLAGILLFAGEVATDNVNWEKMQ